MISCRSGFRHNLETHFEMDWRCCFGRGAFEFNYKIAGEFSSAGGTNRNSESNSSVVLQRKSIFSRLRRLLLSAAGTFWLRRSDEGCLFDKRQRAGGRGTAAAFLAVGREAASHSSAAAAADFPPSARFDLPILFPRNWRCDRISVWGENQISLSWRSSRLIPIFLSIPRSKMNFSRSLASGRRYEAAVKQKK